jgi:UDP-2,3-diacylglucosamine hydrolase
MIDKLLVIAGAGSYPRLLVEGARKAGCPAVEILAVRGSTASATCAAATAVWWTSIGSLAKGIRDCGLRGYDGVIMAGQINPLSLFRGRFEPEVVQWLKELPVKNAHSVFGKLIEKLEANGLKVLPASLFMENHLPGEGAMTARGLSDAELSDVAHGIAVARDMGVHDVGQTVMVKSGMVLAVEAFEGTNAAILRGGKLGGKGSVLFKAAREGHDWRFDIPVVGIKTLKTMKKAGATALAFQSGRLILLDHDEVVRYADRHGIAIVGVDSGLPPAPTRV